MEPQKRKRGRPSKAAQAQPDDAAANQNPSRKQAEAVARKRGRPRKRARVEEAEVNSDEAEPEPKQKGRRSEGSEKNEGEKRRRGRPRKSSPSVEQRKVARRRSQPESEEQDEQEQEAAETDHDAQLPAPYRQLVTRTRLIPLATMTSKWAPLEKEALAAVQALLSDCARPVLSHMGGGRGQNSERRQEQSRLAIAAATRRLRSKLAKGIPFPPVGQAGRAAKTPRRGTGGGSGREAEFDYDRTLESVQALEQQLDPLQHAVVLLERQRAREERALEADYAALRQLEANAQAEMRTWRERERRLHVLVPAGDEAASAASTQPKTPAAVELSKRAADDDSAVDLNLSNDTDKELLALSTQLGDHMESLKSNLQQIEGVVPAIAQSKAALQTVLHRHLDVGQLERIVLGG